MATRNSLAEHDNAELSSLMRDEAVKLDLEDCPVDQDNLDALVDGSLEDFPEDTVQDDISEYAARIARANITQGTRDGHIWITKHYIAFCKRRDPNWDPLRVDWRTLHDIRDFITQKCGSKEEGCEGRKYSTAVSTRAALTFWYKTIRPHESVSEWRHEPKTGECSGLPTRSRVVSTFMVGLEKTKAKSGEVSQSARALTLQDMHRLHDECMAGRGKSIMEQRWGVVRYAAYLLAWLMFLRVDEVVNLEFESIEVIPGERSYLSVALKTRKTAQTGILHSWKLLSESVIDSDMSSTPAYGSLGAQICSMNHLIRTLGFKAAYSFSMVKVPLSPRGSPATPIVLTDTMEESI
ncbi:hypothetical protein LshimejAT787_3600030 [Lyophyllum shimeji]|uniref:Uncharacterized protein n=1 Tax=Lyophyllum shimeji TaxID=47721 RepID=A0A9P3Q1Z4_LYOSH|nr:hypothetical protein LshimejAT787_3600030 [Lyophyllum shimeji]